MYGFIGIRTSIISLIVKNQPKFKGIGYSLLSAMAEYGDTIGCRFSVVVDPFKSMLIILKKVGYTLVTRDSPYRDFITRSVRPIFKASICYYINNTDLDLPPVPLMLV